MTAPVSAAAAIRVALVAGLRRAVSAILWFVILCLGGVGALVAGTYILLGFGWALVIAGGLSLLASALLLIGMSRGA